MTYYTIVQYLQKPMTEHENIAIICGNDNLGWKVLRKKCPRIDRVYIRSIQDDLELDAVVKLNEALLKERISDYQGIIQYRRLLPIVSDDIEKNLKDLAKIFFS